MHFGVHVRARLCMSERARAHERRGRRRNTTARPLDVYDYVYVCVSACTCIWMYV
jgi:hypothetical protein